MQKIYNFINGKLVAPKSGKYLDNYNPATGKVYSLVPDSDSEDVEEAVAAAKLAFPAWRDMPTEVTL
jgi:aminomuconate-semialdehyde/2-hydroxymuconate-6-semialdehyde dehydrogenase